eukprot:5060937-Prymnesium_polylepis.1
MLTKRSKAVERERPRGIALGLDALMPRARALVEAGEPALERPRVRDTHWQAPVHVSLQSHPEARQGQVQDAIA